MGHKLIERDNFANGPRYDVGGVRLERPFAIRRLGHFGFNVDDVDAALAFYRDVLGFRVSDILDYRDLIEDPHELDGLGSPLGYFMRHGTDHHSFVLFNRRVREALDREGRFKAGITANQITWQVGSLKEVVDAIDFLSSRGTRISRSGRDTPGSNWHTYAFDPDGHTVELYYGIEQIGWNGHSKPKAMYNRGFREAPTLPQMSEQEEVAVALREGVQLDEGYAPPAPTGQFAVEGISMPRPFAISGIGPVRLFVEDLQVSLDFYERSLGFKCTERMEIMGHGCAFLRVGNEHHALALYPIGLRQSLPVRQDTTSLSFGIRLATYAQLRAAYDYLRERGHQPVELPGQLSPGMRHAFFMPDPAGHLIQFYFEMEQVGGVGKPRNPPLFPDLSPKDWPETIEPVAETFAGEQYLGPWL